MNTITTVRASSWGSLFDCAFKWEGVHLLKIKSPSSPRALLGTAIHAGTAVFDAARIAGQDVSPDDAADVLVQTLRQPDFDVDWRGSDISLREAEATGLALHIRYCTEISPRYEFVAVELETVPLEIQCGGGQIVRLTGTLDRARIRRYGEGVGIADVKTGTAAVTADGVAKTKGHKPQIGTYELLYEHTTGQRCTAPAEIIGLKTKGKAEAATGEIIGARELMVGNENHPGLIAFAADMFRTGLFPPNPQSNLCSPRYCPRWATCPYHD
ncbi:PD-(D/E)XK nuclease family protein [Pseudomonas sp. PDM16]|uniref:RecB family exonuclease n=1 Tax=Pseudomonas sp. PDM16 TaxID=2769292 RepID=UPI00177D9D18|nr:PD-(D/E)XK nuclease family protein [Pseudomonas sp. PDM16]MBD9415897.1 PD-(D/E)XK nuclease family protein [Pseudomonas sp. PDM16]